MKKILNFIEKKIEFIENQKITFWMIIFYIYITVFIQTFFEGFVNFYNQGYLPDFTETFFQCTFWFFSIFISLCIVLVKITGEKINKVYKLLIYIPFTIPLIVFFQLIDLLINKGNKVYVYFIGSFSELFYSFISFGFYNNGIENSLWVKLYFILILIFISLYIFLKTNSFKKVIIGFLISYTVLFSFGSIQTILSYTYNVVTNKSVENFNKDYIYNFYYQDFLNSNLSDRSFVYNLNKKSSFLIKESKNQLMVLLSISILIINILLLSWSYWIYDKRKFIAILKNSRFFRAIHCYILLFLGLIVGALFSGEKLINSLFDFVSIVGLFSALFFAGLYSVWENDEIDIEIDKISNKKRPLPQGFLNKEEWKNLKFLFLFLALNFAFLVSFYTFIFILLFLVVFHIYSKPPLRFKRIPILSSFIMGFNAIVIVWMGFFLSSGTEKLKDFPLKYSLFILISFFLIENIKNIKDIEGDKKNGIKTITNILGEEKSKLIFGFITSVLMLFIPFIFYLNTKTLITSIIFAVIMFLVINKKKFEEKYVFLSYFLFIAFFILSILI